MNDIISEVYADPSHSDVDGIPSGFQVEEP